MGADYSAPSHAPGTSMNAAVAETCAAHCPRRPRGSPLATSKFGNLAVGARC